MKLHVPRRALLAALAVGLACTNRGDGAGDESVTQYHRRATRDGHYVDASLTKLAIATLHKDPTFRSPPLGPTYAQPLYDADARGGRGLLLVATERNEVLALDPAGGALVWQRSLGAPVARSALPCGNIDPLGVTGTPILDPKSGLLFVAAMTTPDGGLTSKQLVFALSLTDGAVAAGWPVDVSAQVSPGGKVFDSSVQHQAGALALLDGKVYVPYGGHWGGCGDYRGWIVAIPIDKPTMPFAWLSRSRGAGIYAPSGIATDGRSLYFATGNTFGVTSWSDGEAILRLPPSLVFSGQAADHFVPADWLNLDAGDVDVAGTGPLLVEVSRASPALLVVALGKDRKATLLDRVSFGGVGGGLSSVQVAEEPVRGAAAAYTTAQGSYVVFHAAGAGCPPGQSGELTAVRLAGTPPVAAVAWCAQQRGAGSPIVSTTDGLSGAIVWSTGAEGSNRLYGFDGDTGAVVFAGGGANDAMGTIRRASTPIVARGRIWIAADDGLHAFTP